MSRRDHLLPARRIAGRTPSVLAMLCACMVLVASMVPSANAQTDRTPVLKAAFLYRFVGFVDWPDSTLRDREAFRVGVYGDADLGAAVEKVFAEPDPTWLRFEVVQTSSLDDLARCRIVYLSEPDPARLRLALDRLAARPILLIGHQPGFALAGGHVNFFVEDQRLRFEVNVEAVAQSGLRMSSRMLALAKIVDASAR